MPNALTAAGLQTATREELVTYFTAQFQDIYGADINLESDTPDGQLMNIFIQSVLDLQDLLVQIYNTFDPDNAVGVVLDQRVAINGIQRQAGTYTITPISLVNSTSVNLYGLDQTAEEPYIISDNEGTRWVLMTTQLGLAAGTHTLDFRAEIPGEQLTIPNTITVPVTVVLGVTSVNNPNVYSTLGVNEETDAQLKVRRNKSVALASQGYLEGLLAALENIDGMASAYVYENVTGTTDANGVPSHSIWVIVSGTAAAVDIANAIYTKRNAGCGMYGDETYTITQVDGSPFVIRWDEVITRELFVFLTVTPIDGVTLPEIDAIKDGIVAALVPSVYETVNINSLATAVQAIDSNALVTNAGFSSGAEQTLNLSGVPASGAFKITYNGVESASIAWNATAGAIETILQAVAGLENVTVTGSLAGQSITVTFPTDDLVLALMYATTNTLQTSGPAPITFTYSEDPQNTLTPFSRQNQFVIVADNIVLLPMQLLPLAFTVDVTDQLQMNGYGGYGTLTYSILTNNSGGSINASSGLFTAGATPGIDTLKVTDSFGNYATATISVG
jgi:hypothetical protein